MMMMNRYGSVVDVVVPKPSAAASMDYGGDSSGSAPAASATPGVGKIYVKFGSPDEAEAAQAELAKLQGKPRSFAAVDWGPSSPGR